MTHNGGLVQINMSYLQIGGDYPFADCLKNGQGPSSIDNTTPLNPDNHDTDGWPTTIYGGGQRDFFFIPSQTSRPGNYVYDWINNGTISATGSLVSGSFSGTDGRAEVSTSSTFLNAGITAIGGSPLKQLRCYHADDEDGIKNHSQIFGTKFLQRLNAAKPDTIRFLDSSSGNLNPVSHWDDRTPLTNRSWSFGYMNKALWAGLTTNSGNDYSVTLAGFALVDKARVLLRFNADATDGVCRLNVSGTGLFPITDAFINNNGGTTIQFSVRYPKAAFLCALTFDAGLQCWIMNGGCTESHNGSFYQGWPPEIMIALCNEVGAHLSIPIPRLAANCDSDFFESFATLAKNTLDSGLKFKAEGPNENWNFANGFTNYYYALTREFVNSSGADSSFDQWYGRAISRMGDVLESVFPGGKGIDYELAIGVHTNSLPANSTDRWNSTRYVTETGNSADAAKFKATELHVTGYWNASKIGLAEETTAAADYAAAVGAPAKAAVVDAYMTAYADAGLAIIFALHAAWAAKATELGLQLSQYEGDYSPDYTGTAEVNTFRAATKSWPGLYRCSCINYQTFIKVYGGIAPSRYHFSSSSPWSANDPDIWAADSPGWTAIVDTSNGVRPFQLVTIVDPNIKRFSVTTS